MISTAIQQLVNYGLDTGLILPDDEIYIRNQLLMTMQLDDFTAPESEVCYTDLESILKTLVDDAVARGVCEDNSTARDLFDTKLMGVLTPRPSIVRANFEERYENEGPQAATDWFYKFSQDTDYIRRYRIKRDLKWVTKTPYGDLDITINLSKPEKDPKAIAAAKLANVDKFAEKLPDGWNANIGENGCELSGGERQRISIARAFLKDAPIILLDEATASLDVENETAIQEALSRLIKNKTVLIIAHRMRTVAGADHIVVLENGHVAEQGTPAELMERGGLYRRMVELQSESAQWQLNGARP